MKSRFFYSILILVFLAACAPAPEDAAIFAPPAGRGSDQNMTKITVYLDGYEPPAQSRVINKPISIMSCDYFEVVFVGKDDKDVLVTARGQWRIGEKAGVNGVYRTAGGVNYGGVSPDPAAGAGSALLLAGKSDKTLMAIGKLSSATSVITDDTKFVTFEVAAVEAGISVQSFQTASLGSPTSSFDEVGHTDIDSNYSIAGIYFQAFRLPLNNNDIKATYEFKLDASSVTFNTYAAGLFVSGKGVPYKKRPSYTMVNGYNITSTDTVPILDIRDETTVVKMINNQTVGDPFDPVVQFQFDTQSAAAGGVFALVFQVPIYVLVPECVWYVRPGYGVLNYELDNGTGGLGGAVLIKTGNAEEPKVGSTEFRIKVMHPPAKWRYRWIGNNNNVPSINAVTTGDSGNPPEEYDRVFRIGPITDGLTVYPGLEVRKFNISDQALNHFNNGEYVGSGGTTNVIPYKLLTFIIGEKELPPDEVANGTYKIPDIFYGLVEVTVKHTDINLISEKDKFFILVSGNYYYNLASNESNQLITSHYDYASLNGLTSTLALSTVSTDNNLSDALNGSVANRIHIIRLTGAGFNIPSSTIQTVHGTPGQSRLLMFVSDAGNDNLVLGRGGSGTTGYSITVSGDNSGLTAFYFGKWPFENLKNSPSGLNNTKAFKVNAAGSYLRPTEVVYTDKKMIIDTNVPRGGIYNVDLGKGVTVNPDERLLH